MVLLPIAVTRIISHGAANHCADACQVSTAAKQNVKLTGNIAVLVKCCDTSAFRRVGTWGYGQDQGLGTLCSCLDTC